KDEKYRLIWKQRTGFARMAIEAGCPIVPFGAVGAEECFDILLDADHPVFAPARAVVGRLGGNWDLVWPVVRGFGPTPLPRPQQFYFGFGASISTDRWAGRGSARPTRRGPQRRRGAGGDAASRARGSVAHHRAPRGLRARCAPGLNPPGSPPTAPPRAASGG
ncbi:MAG: acyltransferase, partial [Actinomycetota bacterium]|nr:acyltransferase [Actinomycetota bacterium]